MKHLPKAIATGVAATLFLTLAACSGEPTVQETTKTIIDAGWAKSTAQEKDDVCMGITLFGKEGTETLLRGSVKEPGTPELDYAYAAEILEEKCLAER